MCALTSSHRINVMILNTNLREENGAPNQLEVTGRMVQGL